MGPVRIPAGRDLVGVTAGVGRAAAEVELQSVSNLRTDNGDEREDVETYEFCLEIWALLFCLRFEP
jgi:hypothetical protein